MIRTLVAHNGALVRSALAFVLGAERDIEVVAETGQLQEVKKAAFIHRPDVSILDLDLFPPEDLPRICVLHRSIPGHVLMLTETHRLGVLGSIMAEQAPGLGFVTKEGPPRKLVTAVRMVARGGRVLDPDLVVSALRVRSPLTLREAQVLSVAAEGAPVSEIAARLQLAPGTVRNHLSRTIAKAGARTSIEAVRIAHDSGWI